MQYKTKLCTKRGGSSGRREQEKIEDATRRWQAQGGERGDSSLQARIMHRRLRVEDENGDDEDRIEREGKSELIYMISFMITT